MAKRYIHNDTDRVMFVGSILIHPGQGREVDEEFLPPEAPPEAGTTSEEPPAGKTAEELAAEQAAAEAAQRIAELQAEVLASLMPKLPELGDDDLAALAEAESASDTPRKTLMERIGELQLERAQKRAGGAPT